VGDALDGDGLDEGVGDDDLFAGERGGVAGVGGIDVGLEDLADGGERLEELDGEVVGEGGGVGAGVALRQVVVERAADLGFQAPEGADDEDGGVVFEVGGEGEGFVEEAGQEQAEEVHGDLADGSLAGQVLAVQVVDGA